MSSRRAPRRTSTTSGISVRSDGADSYVRGIWAAISAVADDPRRGNSCDVRDGYLQYSVGRHVLFFQVIPDGVDVIRILHQRMDFGRHL